MKAMGKESEVWAKLRQTRMVAWVKNCDYLKFKVNKHRKRKVKSTAKSPHPNCSLLGTFTDTAVRIRYVRPVLGPQPLKV